MVTRAQQAAERQAQRDRRAIQQQQGIGLPNNNFGLTQQLPQPGVSQPTHLPDAPGPSSSTPTGVPDELPLPTTGAINNPLATQLEQALAVIQALQQQQRLTMATSNRNKPDMKVALSLLQRDKWPRLTGPANYNEWRDEFTSVAKASRFWPFFDPDRITPYCPEDEDIALELLRATLLPNVKTTIQGFSDPRAAFSKLAVHRATGSAYLYTLFRRFLETKLSNSSSVTNFRDEVNSIQEHFRSVDPAYVLPPWLVNLWFLCNLNDSFENRISVLYNDPSVVDLKNPKDFNELANDIITEERRRLVTDGTDSITLAAFGHKPKGNGNGKVCSKCPDRKKLGHIYAAAPPGEKTGYCHDHPANAHLKKAFFDRLNENKGHRGRQNNKRGRSNTSPEREESKTRKVETETFRQPALAIRTYGPDD
ncbi:hypothetical protein BDU57DRAFT_310965 [Ampelomyces quisqualis]|uniref:Uncharacterized protein n=1 Tax=Ampelomyces quisqualis TaxID=50730 RepID=A0A6A5QI13_AMPQU|nr:hypothetical protein BDU57DRAFT_310965 [Ampelomyces quisqualis]